jgi:ribulose bisphosphate carboxylase small subunit
MRITQGTFSFLPELTDEEISLQIGYVLRQGWACSVEYTDDPHPRNTYWEMWGLPMFDLHDAAGVLQEVKARRGRSTTSRSTHSIRCAASRRCVCRLSSTVQTRNRAFASRARTVWDVCNVTGCPATRATGRRVSDMHRRAKR